MGNQPRQNVNADGFFGFQHGQPYQQHNQWRNRPGNQFNKDQSVEAMTSKIILMMPKNQESSKIQRFKNQFSRIKIQDSRIKIQE